ncbi:MAG: amidohydrolase family protein [Betaproteobacteria bacterium]
MRRDELREFAPLDWPARAAGRLALTHVTAVPMDSERRLAERTILVEDGLVSSLAASPEEIEGARVVDCSGLYALPGLADMYTHYWDPLDAPLYLAHGITLIRTVSTPFQRALGALAERGAFPSPRMVNLSATIDGVGPDGRTDMPRGLAMTRPLQAQGLVRRFAQAGYRQLKAFSLMSPQNLRALAGAAAAAGLRVSANCPNALTFEEAIEAGVYCLDQLHNIARGHMRSHAPQPQLWDRFDPLPATRLDPAAIRRLGRRLAESGVWNVPTLVFHQRGALAPHEGLQDPALRYVPAPVLRDWEATLVRWSRRARMDGVDAWRKAAAARAQAFLEAVAILHQEGAPLLAGTDSLNPWNVQGRSLHAELANFVAAGMTPFEALRCATSEAARFLGESARCGTLAPGKRADLVLLRADPLRSLSALDEIEAVCVNGYFLARADLDRLLAQRAALARAPAKIPAARVAGGSAWRETIVGAEAGRIAWRHSRTPGGWLIEERHAACVPRRHVERRTSRLALDGEFRLLSCEFGVESFAGEERGRIVHGAAGYELRHADVDGWASSASLAGGPLLPSERLSATLWPLLFASRARAPFTERAIDFDAGTLATVELAFAPQGANDWQLRVARRSHATEQLYRFAQGRFDGMREMMPLLWLRELSPVA